MNLSNHTVTYTTRPSSISQDSIIDSIIDSDEINIIEITNTDNVDKPILHNLKNHKPKVMISNQRIFIDNQNTHTPANDLLVIHRDNDLLVTHREIFIDNKTPPIINPYSFDLSNINEISYVHNTNCNPCVLIIVLTIIVLLFITIYRNT